MEIGRMGKPQETEDMLPNKSLMKGNGITINSMVLEQSHGKLGMSLKDSTWRVWNPAKENLFGMMVVGEIYNYLGMLDSLIKITCMVRVLITGMTEEW